MTLIIWFAAILTLTSRVEAQRTLNENGYEISTGFGKETSWFSVKRNGKLLAKHSGLIASDEGTVPEILDILGNGSKQLLIRQDTGGDHCCDVVRIYDLGRSFRLLFKSDGLDAGDWRGFRAFKLTQLDDDPELELSAESYAFEYFDGLPWVSSPTPLLVFDYSKTQRYYRIANRHFSSFVARDIDGRLERAEEVRDSDPGQYAVSMLNIIVDLSYAGDLKRSREVYNSVKPRSSVNLKEIYRVQNSDRAFRAIYERGD